MKKSFKWKALLALIAVWIAVFMQWEWIWGVVFIILVIPEIKTRVAHFMEDVERDKNPIVYWLIIASWILMSLYLILTAISPKLNPESAEFFAYSKQKQYVSKVNDSLTQKPTAMVSYAFDSNSEVRRFKPNKKAEQNKQTLSPNKSANDTLVYDVLNTSKINIVGISKQTTYTNNQHLKDIQSLWESLNENDFSQKIKGRTSYDIYVVYSNYNIPNNGDFTVSIGFQSKFTKGHGDLTTIEIPESTFAVVGQEGDDFRIIESLWQKVLGSDIKRNNTFDVEHYIMNTSDFSIKKTELWVSIEK